MPTLRPFALLLVLLFGGVGCDALGHLTTSLTPTAADGEPVIDPTTGVEPRIYPANAEVGEPLEIELVRLDRKRIRLENRTARNIDGAQLWVNQEYGGSVSTLEVGRRVNVALGRFVNHHGEVFPTGSLLEPEKTDTIVLADLYLDGKLHKLIVRLPENWQDARPLGA